MDICEKLFEDGALPEPPRQLAEKIMWDIRKAKKARSIKRLVLFSFILAGSIGGFAPVVKTVQTSASQSGFNRFFPLLFSDAGLVLHHWQSFSAAVLESLPVAGIAVFLVLVFAFLQSAKFIAKDIKSIFRFSI
ncbi:MAG: hypothetical protein M1127_01250 [Patescibacteria group bacterium]|nr:hypothetical protein [Patescibacteria group bacterium]